MPQLYTAISRQGYKLVENRQFSPPDTFLDGGLGKHEAYRFIAGNSDSAEEFVRLSSGKPRRAFAINHDVSIEDLGLTAEQKNEVYEGKAVALLPSGEFVDLRSLAELKAPTKLKPAKLEERVLQEA